MSGVSNWLQKQRKSDLTELAESIGLKDYDGMKKTDLEAALDEYLTKNSSKYSSDARFTPFYKRRSDSSPVKKEASTALSDVDTKVKQVKRRVTKAAEDLATTDDSETEPARSRALTARTPRASALSNLSFAQNVPLPPSPAVVADAIDRRTLALRRKVSSAYEDSGINETVQQSREMMSTVVAVEAVVNFFELWNIRKEILPDRYAFTIPASSILHTSEYPVKIPDMFLLLTGSFWGPATLWAFTAFIIPLLAAYFYNFTSKPRTRTAHYNYAFDPLTFNVVKAILTFVIYGQDVTLGGLVDLEHVARLNSTLYGGWKGVIVGTGIGALFTLYEAVIKK